MRVFFIRHGKDDDTYRGGWSDLDLISEGKQQVKELAAHPKTNIADYNISHIIASDLRRTVTTAEIISVELDLPIVKWNKMVALIFLKCYNGSINEPRYRKGCIYGRVGFFYE